MISLTLNKAYWLFLFVLSLFFALGFVDFSLGVMLIIIFLNATYAILRKLKGIFDSGANPKPLGILLLVVIAAFYILLTHGPPLDAFDIIVAMVLTVIGFLTGTKVDKVALYDILALLSITFISGGNPFLIPVYTIFIIVPFILRIGGMNHFGALRWDILSKIPKIWFIVLFAVSGLYLLIAYLYPSLAMPVAVSYLALGRVLERE